MLVPSLQYIVGMAGNTPGDKGYQDAAANALATYSALLPGVKVTTGFWYQYAGQYGVGPFVPLPANTAIVAHSFGGGAAIRSAKWTIAPIPLLVLLDPVDCMWWGPGACVDNGHYTQTPPFGGGNLDAKANPFPATGNSWAWQIPGNVAQAICFYRADSSMPWSAPLRPAPSNGVNFLRTIPHNAFPNDPLVLNTVKLAMQIGI